MKQLKNNKLLTLKCLFRALLAHLSNIYMLIMRILWNLPNTTGRCPTLKYVGLSAHSNRVFELPLRFRAFCFLPSAFCFLKSPNHQINKSPILTTVSPAPPNLFLYKGKANYVLFLSLRLQLYRRI